MPCPQGTTTTSSLDSIFQALEGKVIGKFTEYSDISKIQEFLAGLNAPVRYGVDYIIIYKNNLFGWILDSMNHCSIAYEVPAMQLNQLIKALGPVL